MANIMPIRTEPEEPAAPKSQIDLTADAIFGSIRDFLNHKLALHRNEWRAEINHAQGDYERAINEAAMKLVERYALPRVDQLQQENDDLRDQVDQLSKRLAAIEAALHI
jgi:hypothetical protein